MKIFEKYNLSKEVSKIVSQLDENIILKRFDEASVFLFESNKITEKEQRSFQRYVRMNTTALFEKLYINKKNKDYDVLYYKVVSPQLDEKITRYGFNMKLLLNETKKLIHDYNCPILLVKKGSINEIKIKYEKDFIKKSLHTLNEEKLHSFWYFGYPTYYKKVLYEGLIKTYDIEDTKKMLLNQFKLDIHQVTCQKNTKESFELARGQNIIIELFPDQMEMSENIIKYMNTYGWFSSRKNWEYDIFHRTYYLIFEPKFDLELSLKEKTEKLFYHITPSIYWDNKISKIGLCPKSQSKQSQHPERVYLTYEKTEFKPLTTLLFRANKLKYEYKKEYSLLKIGSCISSIRLFFDINYSGGVYTMENIPPDCIEEVERYSLNKNGYII